MRTIHIWRYSLRHDLDPEAATDFCEKAIDLEKPLEAVVARLHQSNISDHDNHLQPQPQTPMCFDLKGFGHAPTSPALTRAEDANFSVTPVQARSDGTFQFSGVAPGQYDLSASVSPNDGVWTLGSATYAQTDLLDSGIRVAIDQDLGDLRVRLIDRHTTLTGILVDTLGRPTSDYFVIVFPADQALWTTARRTRRLRTGHNGEYEFQDMRPGKYLVAALTDVDQADLSDPAFSAS